MERLIEFLFISLFYFYFILFYKKSISFILSAWDVVCVWSISSGSDSKVKWNYKVVFLWNSLVVTPCVYTAGKWLKWFKLLRLVWVLGILSVSSILLGLCFVVVFRWVLFVVLFCLFNVVLFWFIVVVLRLAIGPWGSWMSVSPWVNFCYLRTRIHVKDSSELKKGI